MTLKEIYDGIEKIRPSICKNMEGTCDECPFGVWDSKTYGYNCGFEIFKSQIEDYAEIEETITGENLLEKENKNESIWKSDE